MGVEPLPLLPRAAFVSLLILVITFTTFAQSSPVITKVDPPSWWSNHSINPLRLLISGRNLSGARIRSPSAHFRVTRVSTPSASYAFADLHIDRNVKPGKYRLVLETNAGRAEVPFTIEAPLAVRQREEISPDDVIYLIMIDRFADGDQKNNNPSNSPREANDARNPRAFHGGDLRGIIDRLPYLKDLGVTALWLTPWHDNWNGVNRCDKPWCPNTYYHGYHAVDYYAVEDRFGDLATLRELVDKAHALGLKVIQDQVANHVGSQHPWVADPPLPNWFHGTLANHQLNRFQNSVLLSPHSNQLVAQRPHWRLACKNIERRVPEREIKNRIELGVDPVPAGVTADEERSMRRIAFEDFPNHPEPRILPVQRIRQIANERTRHVLNRVLTDAVDSGDAHPP